jgi:hypothetical protein
MMRTAAEDEQVIPGEALDSVAGLAARAGHGLATVGCSDEFRFGFVRREAGAGGRRSARCRGSGSFGSQGAGRLVQREQAQSLGRA